MAKVVWGDPWEVRIILLRSAYRGGEPAIFRVRQPQRLVAAAEDVCVALADLDAQGEIFYEEVVEVVLIDSCGSWVSR